MALTDGFSNVVARSTSIKERILLLASGVCDKMSSLLAARASGTTKERYSVSVQNLCCSIYGIGFTSPAPIMLPLPSKLIRSSTTSKEIRGKLLRLMLTQSLVGGDCDPLWLRSRFEQHGTLWMTVEMFFVTDFTIPRNF